VGITFASIHMHDTPLNGAHRRFFAETPVEE